MSEKVNDDDDGDGGHSMTLGLGYHHHHHHSSSTGVAFAAPTTRTTASRGSNSMMSGDVAGLKGLNGVETTGSAAADVLMQHYLQQCLDYHQEKQQQQQEQQGNKNSDDGQQQQQHFVRGSTTFTMETTTTHTLQPPQYHGYAARPIKQEEEEEQQQPPNQPQQQQQQQQQDEEEEEKRRIEEGRLRAQAILSRFQQQQEELLLRKPDNTGEAAPAASVPVENTNAPASASLQTSLIQEQELQLFVYAQEQRQRSLAQEEQRKHKALLKNFSYLARKDEAQMERLDQQVDQARQAEQHMQERYRTLLDQRRQKQKQQQTTAKPTVGAAALHSQAGIGTSKRKRVERLKQATGNTVSSTSTTDQNSSVAVYISGLPVEEEKDMGEEEEDRETDKATETFIRELFSHYGRIRKIHLYRNKDTGVLKGDGLVVYQVSKDIKEQEDLLQAVCSQMNGAQLPGGSVLSVEPASSDYNKKSGRSSSHHQPTTATMTEANQSNALVNTAVVEDEQESNPAGDDLDSFFASL